MKYSRQALLVIVVTVVTMHVVAFAHEMTVRGTVAAIEPTRIQIKTGEEKAGQSPAWYPIDAKTKIKRGAKTMSFADARIGVDERIVAIVDHPTKGASVTPGQMLSRESTPYFEVPAQVVQVNTGTISVFEYGDATAARLEAARVSPYGSFVGNTSILWIGPPHFYRNGRLIVIYVGPSLEVLQPLEAVLGPPFAH
jgi:hypothetical protein